MFAARVDQENAIHARQTAAASKPLNQGILGAKTPGKLAPKTPHKVPLNDENEADKYGGKGTGKKGLGGKQQGGKIEKNLFQTPAPRGDRPALGFKTTNLRATSFQTPAPKTLGPSPLKTVRRTGGKAKLQIHKEVKEAEPEIDWANEEIQYIPPRPIPLEDVPSDDEWDKLDFSKINPKLGNFEGEHIRRANERKLAQIAADNLEQDKRDQERTKKEIEEFDRTIEDQLRLSDYEDDVPAKKAMAVKPLSSRPLGTLASRSAASALSQPKNKIPSFMAPTVSAKAKVPTGSVLGHKKTPSMSSGANARTSSYQTLGYAKGRAVSSTIRPPSSTSQQDEQVTKPKRKDPLRELEEMIEAREMEEAGILAADLQDLDIDGGVLLDEEEEEEELFQFKIPDI